MNSRRYLSVVCCPRRYGAAHSAEGRCFRNLEAMPFNTLLHENTHQRTARCQFINFIDISDSAGCRRIADETMGGERGSWDGKWNCGAGGEVLRFATFMPTSASRGNCCLSRRDLVRIHADPQYFFIHSRGHCGTASGCSLAFGYAI